MKPDCFLLSVSKADFKDLFWEKQSLFIMTYRENLEIKRRSFIKLALRSLKSFLNWLKSSLNPWNNSTNLLIPDEKFFITS